ncbi:MAG TPA: hypothetical protein VJH03_10385 [Blastocatellia bacterium]|nr:hypothetical protein [Blastocatellia bacterium]
MRTFARTMPTGDPQDVIAPVAEELIQVMAGVRRNIAHRSGASLNPTDGSECRAAVPVRVQLVSPMIRYKLDELGWYQFEKLVQAVLKAELGLSIESWGGHSDRGRDSYSKGPLPFPNKEEPSEGPFVFQAKFVQGANAAGARSETALLRAVYSEERGITEKLLVHRWRSVRHYVLLTNAPLGSSLRTSIEEHLTTVLPEAQVTSLGGNDICDLLDAHPPLRRSFPEILSLRDLDVLLSEVVNKSVLERSRAAIDEARELVPVFVRTRSYYNAFATLAKHGFLVLDGPPEMGKTAIARIVSLAQVLHGWQAVDCRHPDDLFSSYDYDTPQVFVVDDALEEPNTTSRWGVSGSETLIKHSLAWTENTGWCGLRENTFWPAH